MNPGERSRGEAAKNWGATPGEIASAFACDALGFAHDDTFHRAIAIAAPSGLVFRWLCQLRAGPYSYDLVDNFGRPSPRELRPALQRLALGQRAMTIFRIAGFTRGRDLTIVLGSRAYAALLGDLAGTYRIDPTPGGCRLVARILVRYPRGIFGRVLRAIVPTVDLIMFRKQLETLRDFAERDAQRAALGNAP